MCREDVLYEAYRRCRANRGAPGVDGQTFERIEEHGLATWLQRLRQELRTKRYRCAPLLLVMRGDTKGALDRPSEQMPLHGQSDS